MNSNRLTVYHPKDLPKNKTVLVFAPHPDDTSICAGGTALLLAKQNRVLSVVMTTGHRAKIEGLDQKQRTTLREKEAKKEGELLDLSTLFLRLDLYDTGKIGKKDLEKISRLLSQHKPEIILLPNLSDPHPTHHLCTQIVLQAVQKFTQLHSMNIDLWHYESPWSLFNREDFNVMVSIPKKSFEQKLKAIRAHASQNNRTPYDVIAASLAQMRSAIVTEQTLSGYGEAAIKVDPFVELFSVVHTGRQAQLVETFSGVRGIFLKGLTPEIAKDYGYAYGNWLKRTLDVNPKVVVGMDTRPSGPILKEAIMEGLTRAHCHIFDVDIATTPMVQFEVRNRKCNGGIIITASHNEPHWNGFKFFWHDGGAISPEQMQQVINSHHAEVKDPERPFVEHYIRFLCDWIGEKTIEKIRRAKLKVVVDPNGGAIIVVLKKLLDLLNVERVELNMEHGEFAHTIEPTPTALKHLGPIIRKHKAHFGVAWDCDGDRIEIVLPNGELLSGHYILALVVDQVLKKTKKNKTVVVNAGTSGVVAAVAKKHKAKVVETDVGETNVVGMMKKTKAAIGGEGGAGGCIIPPSRCRDGLMTLLKIFELMVEQKKSLEQLLKLYPRYYTRHCNISIDLTQVAKLRDEIKKHFSSATPRMVGGANGSLKLHWNDGTFLWLRASKTESNLVRLLVDSPHRSQTDKIYQEATQWLQKWGNPAHSV